MMWNGFVGTGQAPMTENDPRPSNDPAPPPGQVQDQGHLEVIAGGRGLDWGGLRRDLAINLTLFAQCCHLAC